MSRREGQRHRNGRLVVLKGRADRAGVVWLVGAGPGDPDLLTLKALRLLRAADVVVHDRLTPQPILDLAGPNSRLIDVGKRKSHHTLPQDDINQLLVALAREGHIDEAAQVIAPVVKFQRELAARNHGDRWQPVELARALFAQALTDKTRSTALLREAAALLDATPPAIRNLHDIKQWRERVRSARSAAQVRGAG